METNNQQQALESIVRKAWENNEFKKELLNNPVHTVENFLGRPLNLPEGKKLAFVDQTDSTTIFINIPAEQKIEDMELTEDQLDVISGGGPVDPKIILNVSNGNQDILGG